MFQQLSGYVSSALSRMQAALPTNPQAATQIGAKLTILRRSTLAAEISSNRLFAEATVQSIDGRTIQLAALFPEERMRSEATDALRRLSQALPVLEQFLDTRFPENDVWVWYGFLVGNSGGDGVVDVEDRSSYNSRTPPNPYDATLDHELAHTYIGNETLTQFLEMYAANRIAGRSIDVATWSHTRGYTGPSDSNEGSALVMDVYQLLGHDSTSRGYKVAQALAPPYNAPLSPGVIQAFVDQAPAAAKTQVALKLGKIVF